jgi:hypothetical protein
LEKRRQNGFIIPYTNICLLNNESRLERFFTCICREKWGYNWTVHQLFIDFKKAYDSDSIKREVPYNILLQFGIFKKPVELIKMCLNEAYSKVRVDKLLSDTFSIKNGLKGRDH